MTVLGNTVVLMFDEAKMVHDNLVIEASKKIKKVK